MGRHVGGEDAATVRGEALQQAGVTEGVGAEAMEHDDRRQAAGPCAVEHMHAADAGGKEAATKALGVQYSTEESFGYGQHVGVLVLIACAKSPRNGDR